MRPIHVMSPIAAMAVYGVPEREVDALIEAFAPTLLARERLEPATVVWLHGAELALDPPSGFRATLRIPRGAVEHAPHLLLELLG
jgi:hypothetical protein